MTVMQDKDLKLFFGLRDKYWNVFRDRLMRKFNYSNVMQIPKISKIVLNIGVGKASGDKSYFAEAEKALMYISGRKPLVMKSKKSIAAFKVRKGDNVGLKVTLRNHIMYEFLERLINIALPLIRDFKGFSSRQFDSRGNFSLRIKEHHIFPEIDYNRMRYVFGLDISVITTAVSDNQAKELLSFFGFPFIS